MEYAPCLQFVFGCSSIHLQLGVYIGCTTCKSKIWSYRKMFQECYASTDDLSVVWFIQTNFFRLLTSHHLPKNVLICPSSINADSNKSSPHNYVPFCWHLAEGVSDNYEERELELFWAYREEVPRPHWKILRLGSSSEIMLQNRSSDSLHSESLTWLPRRTRNHNPALSTPPSVPEHTTASQHQQPHPARNSLPKASGSVRCSLLPYTRRLMVLDDAVLPPILHPSRTAHCPGKSARITEEISVIFRHFHDI